MKEQLIEIDFLFDPGDPNNSARFELALNAIYHPHHLGRVTQLTEKKLDSYQLVTIRAEFPPQVNLLLRSFDRSLNKAYRKDGNGGAGAAEVRLCQ